MSSSVFCVSHVVAFMWLEGIEWVDVCEWVCAWPTKETNDSELKMAQHQSTSHIDSSHILFDMIRLHVTCTAKYYKCLFESHFPTSTGFHLLAHTFRTSSTPPITTTITINTTSSTTTTTLLLLHHQHQRQHYYYHQHQQHYCYHISNKNITYYYINNDNNNNNNTTTTIIIQQQ